MKVYIRFKQHKKSTSKYNTNETTTEVLPWNDQGYKITWEGGGGGGLQAPKRIDNTSVALLSPQVYILGRHVNLIIYTCKQKWYIFNAQNMRSSSLKVLNKDIM